MIDISRRSFVVMLLIVFTSMVMMPSALANSTEQENRASLKALKKELKRLQKDLNRVITKRDKQAQQLSEKEKQLATLHRQANELKNEQLTIAARLEQLETERIQLVTRQRQQMDLLREDISAAYRSSQEESLKLLLSQNDPELFSRMLVYYQYLVSARSDRLEAFLLLEEQLQSNLLSVQREKVRLNQTLQRIDAQTVDLQVANQERKKILTALNNSVQTKQANIAEKEANQKRLSQLIKTLSDNIAQLKPETPITPMYTSKGKYPWPSQGKIVHRFGTQRAGTMTWNGVVIKANAGKPVNVLHYGRVVFSDYLRGYGLLVIVDHENGYLTLYGHNQMLYVSVGDWVKPAQKIAEVGDSGGQAFSNLYFEIRKNGRPQNPVKWCR